MSCLSSMVPTHFQVSNNFTKNAKKGKVQVHDRSVSWICSGIVYFRWLPHLVKFFTPHIYPIPVIFHHPFAISPYFLLFSLKFSLFFHQILPNFKQICDAVSFFKCTHEFSFFFKYLRYFSLLIDFKICGFLHCQYEFSCCGMIPCVSRNFCFKCWILVPNLAIWDEFVWETLRVKA